MDERTTRTSDGITLCYERLGPSDGEPLVLVMGLGTQLLGWPGGFLELLADEGFALVRFDNRDIGRSTKLRDRRPPTSRDLVLRNRRAAAYDLGAMARDTVELMDALDLPSAHLAGVSMGGMIAQTVAARHPGRVRSLTSIMSSTGNRWRGQAAPSVLRFLLPRARPASVEEAVQRYLALYRRIGSPGFASDPDELRRVVEQSIARAPDGSDLAGTGRQLMAIIASGDRTPELRRITAPTAVVHGTADRLVAPSGGKATAAAIPGATLTWIEGMGHDLPRGAWPRIVQVIAANARRAALV